MRTAGDRPSSEGINMAKIRPFIGLRPKREVAPLVAELPYDVATSEEAREVAAKNEYSFYHITKPEVDLPEQVHVYDDRVYQTGRENLDAFIRSGILQLDESPKFFLYTLIMEEREQTGLVACVHIDDYMNNVIRKHELTREEKELDRSKHMDVLNAQTGLVFMLYRQTGGKTMLFEKGMGIEPEYDFITSDTIRHIFRVISDKDLCDSFVDAFRDEILYIADGHHRAASAVRVGLSRRDAGLGGESEWFMAVIFPHDQVRILPYNRVVRGLGGGIDSLLKRLAEKYDVQKTDHPLPDSPRKFCMYLKGEWFRLIPRFTVDKTSCMLDVAMLQETILEPLLNIENPRTDSRIEFIGGIKGSTELEHFVDSEGDSVAFSLYPVSVEELMRVSDSGGIMPPKSTWFEPKLRSGLVLHLL